jgi:hypothetical protein
VSTRENPQAGMPAGSLASQRQAGNLPYKIEGLRLMDRVEGGTIVSLKRQGNSAIFLALLIQLPDVSENGDTSQLGSH